MADIYIGTKEGRLWEQGLKQPKYCLKEKVYKRSIWSTISQSFLQKNLIIWLQNTYTSVVTYWIKVYLNYKKIAKTTYVKTLKSCAVKHDTEAYPSVHLRAG